MPAAQGTRRSNREIRTAAILDAARTAFVREGYEAAKISDIASAVGVVEGTVFHYYPSKRHLVLALIEDFYREITYHVNEEIHGIEGIRNQLYIIIHHHLKVVRDNAALCGVILKEARGVDNVLTEDVRARNREYTQCLVDVIHNGIATGELDADTDVNLVRNIIFGSIEHALWSALAEGRPVEVEQMGNKLTDIVYRGICSSTPGTDEDEVLSLVHKLNSLMEARQQQ
jgi:TetR/AcrR family transcriptional regulator, fatty acid metabolism regulator protein